MFRFIELLNKIVRSRTVWMIVLMVIINTVTEVQYLIPEGYRTPLNDLLGIAAAYFRINQRQDFSK